MTDAASVNFCSPREVGALLRERGIRPSKALGQNFLVDRNVLARIVEAAALPPGARVLEVGAGLGVLTAALLEYKQRRYPESTRSMFSLDDGPADPSMQADSARRRELLRSRIGLEGLRIASAGRLRKFGFYSPNGMIDMSDLRSYIRRRGGVYQSTIGKDTDCVICNDPTLVPDKIQQAAQFGVPVITEAEFLHMASERPRFNYTGI